MSPNFFQQITHFNPKFEEPLSRFTTWKIGGPAEVLVEIKNSEDLKKLLQISIKNQVPYTILGNGSNILISGEGLRGLVVINKSKEIHYGNPLENNTLNELIPHRHPESNNSEFYSFTDLDYQETGPTTKVTFDSGVLLSYAIANTLKNGFSGLQWFAGIPGTIGGSLYNNIHGGTKHFSDNFLSATILDENGQEKEVDYNYFGFGYDKSILRENSKIIILKVTLKLYTQNVEKAKLVAAQWLKRKAIQPKISCGSVFQCITLEQQKALNFPSPSAGYIIDKVLNWRGRKSGGVWISEKHANFIENTAQQGSANDVLKLIKDIRSETEKQLKIKIYPEINFLGFTKDELVGVRD